MGAKLKHEEAAYKVFVTLWALSVLVDRAKRHGLETSNLAVVVPGILLMAFPGSVWLLGLFAFSQVWFWVTTLSPQIIWNVSGHLHLVFLLGLLAHMIRARGFRLSAAAMARTLAGPARCICLMSMCFAGFAKLNQDFLEPQLSCGAIYYLWLAESPLFFFLPTSIEAQSVGIWFAVAAEFLGPILVLWKRTRLVGLMLLLAIWLGLALNPRSHYFDFAGLFAAMAIFFLPPSLIGDAWARGNARLGAAIAAMGGRADAKRTALVRRVIVIAGGSVLSFGSAVGLDRSVQLELYRFAIVGFWLALIGWVCWGYVQARPRPVWPKLWTPSSAPVVWLVPLVFFLNEVSAYVGFPHRPTLTMAANLVANPIASNHLIVNPVPTISWSAPVQIKRSGSTALKKGQHMPWLHFVDVMAQHPEAKVHFRVAGGEVEKVLAGKDPRFARRSAVSQWLRLKPYSGRPDARVACPKPPPGMTRKEWRKEAGRRKKALQRSAESSSSQRH